jgi:hypothetical protein
MSEDQETEQKQPTKRVLKLSSGEMIMGNVMPELDDNRVIVQAPRLISLQPVGQGQMKYVMLPMPGEALALARHAVVGELLGIPRQLLDEYIYATTGIMTGGSAKPRGVA